jgi:hypothetical protein
MTEWLGLGVHLHCGKGDPEEDQPDRGCEPNPAEQTGFELHDYFLG